MLDDGEAVLVTIQGRWRRLGLAVELDQPLALPCPPLTDCPHVLHGCLLRP